MYSGDNGYKNRDFRFLGTIGLFDEVPLKLKRGENQLVLAVSENFGGWGVVGKFEDTDNINFSEAVVQD